MTSHGYDVKISTAPYRRYKYSCRDERQYICRTTQICSRATRLHRCTSSYIPAARPFAISLIIPDDSARPGLFGICNLHWLEFLRRNRYESPLQPLRNLAAAALREFVNDRARSTTDVTSNSWNPRRRALALQILGSPITTMMFSNWTPRFV